MQPALSSRRALWLALFICLGLAMALFSACGDALQSEPTATPTRTPRPTATPTPSPTPTPAWPVTVYIPQELPDPIVNTLNAIVGAHPDFFAPVQSVLDADVVVAFDPDGATATPVGSWVYAVVAPFPTLADEVAWEDVLNCWRGTPSGPFAGRPLLMDADTQTVLTVLLGPAAEGAVSVVPVEQLLDIAWANRPSWAVVPFERLEPRWKVLRVDTLSVLDKGFDVTAYPLVARAGLTGLERGIAKLQEFLGAAPLANRDPSKMSVVVMTGVTAMGRCTAVTMDTKGVTYPGEAIRPWLLEADITHISNEASFSESCTQACVVSVVFCSKPQYIGLFEDLDVDVIELTGNHLLDWGVEAMKLSLSMYEERGIPYYGGGWNLAQAMRPVTIAHGVHTFGFVGCNPVGPSYDHATEDRPGSAPCNFGLLAEQLGPQVRQLREQGIIPIVTLQYEERDQFEPTFQQMADFRALVDVGAAIVSGSQAHHPQAFDFHNGVFIHYGLGNLFFDQVQIVPYRQTFIDRHVFYDGRHISTELLTAMRDDYARPRPMTLEERQALLSAAFAASGW